MLPLLMSAALAVPAPYEVQETQPHGSGTVILAAYVSPDAVGHSLLILRNSQGKTLWKHYLGWKYRLDEHPAPNVVSVTTVLASEHTNLTKSFDVRTGKLLGVRRWIQATPTH